MEFHEAVENAVKKAKEHADVLAKHIKLYQNVIDEKGLSEHIETAFMIGYHFGCVQTLDRASEEIFPVGVEFLDSEASQHEAHAISTKRNSRV